MTDHGADHQLKQSLRKEVHALQLVLAAEREERQQAQVPDSSYESHDGLGERALDADDANTSCEEDENGKDGDDEAVEDLAAGESEDAEETVLQDPARPLFDAADAIWRCGECSWEVIDGECQGIKCSMVYALPDQVSRRLSQATGFELKTDASSHTDRGLGRGLSSYFSRLFAVIQLTNCPPPSQNPDVPISTLTESPLENPDRTMYPRGTTPLLEVPAWAPRVPHSNSYYADNPTAFGTLVSRGATPAMVELYQLEWTDEEGIVAWADEDLFDEFSSDSMKEGAKWKIYLGRRIVLDPADPDGTKFVEDLVEEICGIGTRTRSSAATRRCWEGSFGLLWLFRLSNNVLHGFIGAFRAGAVFVAGLALAREAECASELGATARSAWCCVIRRSVAVPFPLSF